MVKLADSLNSAQLMYNQLQQQLQSLFQNAQPFQQNSIMDQQPQFSNLQGNGGHGGYQNLYHI